MFGSAYLLAVDLSTAVLAAEEAPKNVKAGWTALIIVLAMAAAVVVIGVSLSRQLKRAQQAKDAGVYGDPVVTSTDESDSSSSD